MILLLLWLFGYFGRGRAFSRGARGRHDWEVRRRKLGAHPARHRGHPRHPAADRIGPEEGPPAAEGARRTRLQSNAWKSRRRAASTPTPCRTNRTRRAPWHESRTGVDRGLLFDELRASAVLHPLARDLRRARRPCLCPYRRLHRSQRAPRCGHRQGLAQHTGGAGAAPRNGAPRQRRAPRSIPRGIPSPSRGARRTIHLPKLGW